CRQTCACAGGGRDPFFFFFSLQFTSLSTAWPLKVARRPGESMLEASVPEPDL
ncbi:unnamed protein product, partial [Ectocarpus sp. 12 AP-2014]